MFLSVRPAGKVSSTRIELSAAGLPAGLVKAKVRVVVPPLAKLAAPNDLVKEGGR